MGFYLSPVFIVSILFKYVLLMDYMRYNRSDSHIECIKRAVFPPLMC